MFTTNSSGRAGTASFLKRLRDRKFISESSDSYISRTIYTPVHNWQCFFSRYSNSGVDRRETGYNHLGWAVGRQQWPRRNGEAWHLMLTTITTCLSTIFSSHKQTYVICVQRKWPQGSLCIESHNSCGQWIEREIPPVLGCSGNTTWRQGTVFVSSNCQRKSLSAPLGTVRLISVNTVSGVTIRLQKKIIKKSHEAKAEASEVLSLISQSWMKFCDNKPFYRRTCGNRNQKWKNQSVKIQAVM